MPHFLGSLLSSPVLHDSLTVFVIWVTGFQICRCCSSNIFHNIACILIWITILKSHIISLILPRGRHRLLDSMSFALFSRDRLGLTCTLGSNLLILIGCWWRSHYYLLRWIGFLLLHRCGRLLCSGNSVANFIPWSATAIMIIILSDCAWMLVRPACLLLFTRVQRESKSLSTFLIVCSRLGHLLPQVDIGVVIIIVIHPRGSWRLRLDNDRVDILNLRYLDLLIVSTAVFPGRTTPSHLLRRIWTITATATAHEGRIMSKLKTLVCLARAHACLVVRANFSPSKPLLELRWAI